MVQLPLGQFNAPLHSTGECFHSIASTIQQADARQNLFNSLLQRGSAQTVKVSLMPEVFVRREFRVDALRLKYDSDMPPQRRRFANHVQAHNLSSAGAWHHERREDPKQSGLATSVGSEEAEQFSRANVERNSVEGRSILVTMDQITHRNDRANSNRLYLRGRGLDGTQFRSHRLFYAVDHHQREQQWKVNHADPQQLARALLRSWRVHGQPE